jgi:hypothetical protein
MVMGSVHAKALKALTVTVCMLLAVGTSQARTWNPTSAGLAQDYAMITDGRPNHDLVLVFWLVPPIVSNSPEAQALLDKYVIVGVVHAQTDVGGTMSIVPTDSLQVQDANGKPLKPVQGAEIPPALSSLMVGMGDFMRRNVGTVGQGVQFFAFEAGAVHACTKGRLSVPFAGEVYTYDTPIPGCSDKP